MMPARLVDGRFLTREERLSLREKFHSSLVKLSGLDAWWMEDARRIVCRSVTVRRRAVPAGGYYLGRFFYPFAAAVFVRELDALLADREK